MTFSEYLYYDETSPSFLRWKVDVKSGQRGNRTMAFAYTPAGYINDSGYWFVGVCGRSYPAHKIIWTMFNGPISKGLEIDHKNRVRTDNNLLNLRLVTKHQNMQNCKMQCNNTTGKTGVNWMFNGVASTYAVAQWYKDGKRFSKYFSANKLGLLPAFKAAVLYRKAVIQRLNDEGASYTETHGT